MTRNDAIKLFREIAVGNGSEGYVDFLIKIGTLKVEEEKTASNRAIDFLREHGITTPASIIGILSDEFEIVEKKK